MSYLYDECEAGERERLEAHLGECEECRARIDVWRSAQGELDQWKLPAFGRPASAIPVLKWGLAALFLLGLGFGFGRLGMSYELKRVRGEVTAELRRDLDGRLQVSREAGQKEMLAMLQEMEKERAAEYSALRKDLETVAVLTEDRIERTQRGLAEVAELTQIKN